MKYISDDSLEKMLETTCNPKKYCSILSYKQIGNEATEIQYIFRTRLEIVIWNSNQTQTFFFTSYSWVVPMRTISRKYLTQSRKEVTKKVHHNSFLEVATLIFQRN